MTLQAGHEAVVSVAVATLWAGPDAVRPVDEPALAVPSRNRAWIAGMTPDDRAALDHRTLTQLLLGERVRVEEVADGWVKVIAAEQPAAKLDKRGYPGWLPVGQVSAAEAPAGTPYMVDAAATALRDEPDGDVVVAGVVIGTRLVAIGAPQRGWVPVAVPGAGDLVWARLRDLVPVPDRRPAPAEVLGVAERLIDVPYIWGGLSAFGLDCSGLVHLAHRRLGVAVPRDADDQYDAAKEIALDEARPGDLYFFANEGRPVHHVGFVAGDGRMVHACANHGRAVLEPIAGERADTLTGARRFV